MLYYIIMNAFPVFAILIGLLASSISPARADTASLNIVVDIPFVASLVQELVEGEDRVNSLINASDSPHTYTLRPRAVRSLQNADLVVTVAEGLSPNITRALVNVVGGRKLNLASVPGMLHLPSRGDNAANIDPHLWLSPVNVQIMVNALRDELIILDPKRKTAFTKAAATMMQNLQDFDQQQQSRWSGASSGAFVSLHDATRYFEDRYQLISKGSLFGSSHATPGVQQLIALKQLIQSENIGCVIADANTPSTWVNTLTEGLDVNAVAFDILGLDPSDVSYLSTLNRVADSFAFCLDVATK